MQGRAILGDAGEAFVGSNALAQEEKSNYSKRIPAESFLLYLEQEKGDLAFTLLGAKIGEQKSTFHLKSMLLYYLLNLV